ncbi:MAG: site-specific integrase, partial [Chitinophagaceae bacterium]
MKVKFYLKEPDSNNETVIKASVSYRQNRLWIYTGVSVLPKYWNRKTHSVRQSPSYRQGSSINSILEKIKGDIETCYYDYKKDHNAEPSPATFRKLIDQAFGKTKEVKLNFYEYFQNFIDRTKAGQRQTAKGKLITPTKYKTYQTTMYKLKEFSPKLDFDSIDLDFYQDLTTWLRKKNFTENYVGGHIKNLKTVLNEATERGQNKNLAFRSKSFTKLVEEVNNIALTESELQDLKEIDLSDIPHLDRVRDLFLIGCYTGLRYGDLSRLTTDYIKDGVIKITQNKTGKEVAIPVHRVVRSIIEKYNGNLPTAISNQKFNEYLKEVCQRVPSLCESASKTRTKGGMKLTTNYQKWQIIGTHTARRTFATNAYLQGMPTVTIMAVTGHETEKIFLKYIKITSEQHAKI